MTPDELRKRAIAAGGMPPQQTPPGVPSIFTPGGFAPPQHGKLGADRSFAPGPGVRVADSGGSAFGDQITPSGVGEKNSINSAAYAYNALMNSLEGYGQNFQPDQSGQFPNIPLMPGVERDTIAAQRRNIQMQMKELYNLGVLNGPDLDLMDQIMLDPLSMKNKLLDVTGIADTEERARANLDQIRTMMQDLVEPKLQAMGVTTDQVYSDDMSDEEFAKWLAQQ